MSLIDFHSRNNFRHGQYDIAPGCAVVFFPVGNANYRLVKDMHICLQKMSGSYSARFSKSAYGLEYKMHMVVKVVETNNPELVNSILACRPSLSGNGEFDFLTAKFENSNDVFFFVKKYLEKIDSDEEEFTIDFPHTVDDIPFEGSISFSRNKYVEPFEDACECCDAEEQICYDIMPEPAMPCHDISEDTDILQLESEKKAFCDKISFLIADFVYNHNVPQEEIIQMLLSGKILLGNNGLSELVINSDLKIILPAYNEMEITMKPLTKALYFLFLRHPEGIRLVDIPDYRKEIEDLYSLIMPNRDENLANISIDNLCDPINNDALRQQISNIKRMFKATIVNEDTAKQYYISGKRGEAYQIPLNRNLVRMPRAIM